MRDIMCKMRLILGSSGLCKARESEINVGVWGEFDLAGPDWALSILFRCEVLGPVSLVLKIH